MSKATMKKVINIQKGEFLTLPAQNSVLVTGIEDINKTYPTAIKGDNIFKISAISKAGPFRGKPITFIISGHQKLRVTQPKIRITKRISNFFYSMFSTLGLIK